MSMIVCGQIRKVNGGYIVMMRWPYSDEVMGMGEVVCKTWAEVLHLLDQARDDGSDPDLRKAGCR